MSGKPRDPEERFWEKVQKTEHCWNWTGIPTAGGYGLIWVPPKRIYAHRYAYELLVGPIPLGLELDHTCHTTDESCPGGSGCPHRRCVNPGHLEPVTPFINGMRGRSPLAQKARQVECIRKHPLSGDNLHIRANGHRVCRTCAQIREAQRPPRRR